MAESSRKEIYESALQLKKSGRLFDASDKVSEDTFKGSVDRFAWIAQELSGCKRILDV